MKFRMVYFFLGLNIAACSSVAFAEGKGLDPYSQEALDKTQAMLRDPVQRQKAVNENQKTKMVDQRVQSLAGSPENSQAIYDLSADLMADLVRETNGDPDKMAKLMELAQKNPEAFANKFSPAQRAKLEAIAKKSPANQTSNPSANLPK